MSAHRAIEPRQPATIDASLRSARGWGGVVNRTMTQRGQAGEWAPPPVRGDYIEVRCGAYAIVARVAWSEADLPDPHPKCRPEQPDLSTGADARSRGLRRAEHVAPPKPSFAERAANSARLGRALDLAAVALAGAAIATFAVGSAQDALALPVEGVRNLEAEGGP